LIHLLAKSPVVSAIVTHVFLEVEAFVVTIIYIGAVIVIIVIVAKELFIVAIVHNTLINPTIIA